MASLGELFISLGFDFDKKKLDSVVNGFKELRKDLIKVKVAFVGAVYGLDRFVNSSLKGVVALQNLSQQTGLSIEKLQKFQQAGQLANINLSPEQINQSLGNLQRTLDQIDLEGTTNPAFKLLGLSPLGKNAFQIIDDLRDRIKGLSPSRATNLISQLGLSPEFINILRLSRKEFEALSQNTFLNKEQRRNIDALGTSITALKLNFKALKDQAVAKIAPSLNEIVQKFFKWLKDNGDRIVNTMSSLAKGVAAFASAVGNAFILTSQFLKNILGLENGIKILAVAFAALSLSFSPFLLGLTAVILLLDDLAVYKRGGDSLFGDLVKGFEDLPNLGKILFGVGGALALGGVVKNIKSLGVALGGLRGLAAILSPITAFFTAAVGFLAYSPQIGEKLAGYIDTAADKDPEGFAGKARFMLDRILGNTEEQTFKRIGLNPSLSSGASSITNNNNITVNGVQDADTFGREAGSAINQVTGRSVNQTDLNRTSAVQGRDFQ